MGWWDTGIMDGDTPADIWSGIKGFLETPPAPEELKKGWTYRPDHLVKRRHMEGRLLDVERFAFEKWGEGWKYRHIMYEVVGFQAMSCGVMIPDELKARIIAATQDDLAHVSDEGWRNPDERRRMLREFIYHLEGYQAGRPVQLRDVGLFEKFANQKEAKACVE